MSQEQNVKAQERLAEIINTRELDKLGEVFAEDVVDHDPAPDQGEGVEGFRAFFKALSTGIPDLEIAPAVLVADDEHVAIAYTVSGTHDGELLGVPPSGERVEFRGVQIARFEDGKIVERWGSSDELGVLKQVKAEKVPG